MTTPRTAASDRIARERRLLFEPLERRDLLSVNILIDNSLDNFVSNSQRNDLQTIADSITAGMSDTLDAVGTKTYSLPYGKSKTTSVAEDTVKVYAYGADLNVSVGYGGHIRGSGSKMRGENATTDFAPHIGYIVFDTDKSWDFTQTEDISIAAHELLHVLGIGTAPSWDRLVDENAKVFTGSKTVAANGGDKPPVVRSSDGDFGHFKNGVASIMSPYLDMPYKTRDGLSAIDKSALDDIGWSFNVSNDVIAGADTSIESFSGATLTFGNWSIGDKDVDMFRIQMYRGTELEFTTFPRDGSSNTVDTFLRLFDAAGNEISSDKLGGQHDDKGYPDRYSHIEYVAERSGLYYVGVSSYWNIDYDPHRKGSGTSSSNPLATGHYDWVASLDAGHSDIGGRLNSALETDLAGTNDSFEKTTALEYEFEEDMFEFQATDGALLTAKTSFPSDGEYPVDTYLRLFDANGRELIASGAGGSDGYAALQYQVRKSGTYYLGVSGKDRNYDPKGGEIYGDLANATGGDYKLAMSLRPSFSLVISGDRVLAEVGDQFSEIIGRTSDGKWWAATGNGQRTLVDGAYFGAWNEAAGWRNVATGDFNGDGLTDVIGRRSSGAWWVGLNNGRQFVFKRFGAWGNSWGWRDAMIGDFNGDGLTDVAGRTSNGVWRFSLSDGNRFTTLHPGKWNEARGWRNVMPGDFNGDGTTDIIGRTRDGRWYVSYVNGTGLSTAYMGRWNVNAGWRDVLTGDFNADGRLDVLARTKHGEWYLRRNTGNALVPEKYGQWNEKARWRSVMVGDFAGDNRLDVIGRTAKGRWYVAVNSPTGFHTKYFGYWSPAVTWSHVMAGNFAGTGKTDVIGRAPGGRWHISEATPSGSTKRPFSVWRHRPWVYADGGTFFGASVDDANGTVAVSLAFSPHAPVFHAMSVSDAESSAMVSSSVEGRVPVVFQPCLVTGSCSEGTWTHGGDTDSSRRYGSPFAPMRDGFQAGSKVLGRRAHSARIGSWPEAVGSVLEEVWGSDLYDFQEIEFGEMEGNSQWNARH